jgi:hypothetical protein
LVAEKPHTAQAACEPTANDKKRYRKMSYPSIGKSNRDDEKIVLIELVPMLAYRNSF